MQYVGIDLNDRSAMISFYTSGMSEPATISMVTGSEMYQIPLCVTKKKHVGQWFCGEEARRIARNEQMPCVDGLLKKSLGEESVEIEGQVYQARDLLFLFLKKLLGLARQGSGSGLPDYLVFTSENMNHHMRGLFKQFADRFGYPGSHLLLLDYRESFYYYAYSQPEELCRHEVALYYYTSKNLLFWQLHADKKTRPQVVTLKEQAFDAMPTDRDEEFAGLAAATLSGSTCSAVYLIGDGFDGDWMKQSLNVVCRGRRAFMGKNLFSKGACYAAAVREESAAWQYVYLGENEIRRNVSIQVEKDGSMQFYTLIEAGENWYEAGRECEVILYGEPVINFWIRHPRSQEAAVKTLELSDLPRRQSGTTRLRIAAHPQSVDKILLTIRDMGFGEIVKSSDKQWEYLIDLA